MSELLLSSEYWDRYCRNTTHKRLVTKINKLIKESYMIYVLDSMYLDFMLLYKLCWHTKTYGMNRIVNGYEYNTFDIHSAVTVNKLLKIEALLQKGMDKGEIPRALINDGTYCEISEFYRDVGFEKHRRCTLRCYVSKFVDSGVMELDRDTISFRVMPMGKYIESSGEFTGMKDEVGRMFKERVGIDVASRFL